MEKPKYKTPRGASATAAKNKYRDANYDRAELALPKGMKAQARAHAESRGETFNAFVTRAIQKAMENESVTSENDVFGKIPVYGGTAIYALVDDYGKKYIGSTINLNQRLRFHATHIKTLLRDGMDGFLCSKMQNAILEGRKFHVEILEKFPNGISKEELNNKECFYLEQEGGLAATYNMKPIKMLNCQPGELLEHRAISEQMERDEQEANFLK